MNLGDVVYLKRFDFYLDENGNLVGYTNTVSKGGYYLFNGYSLNKEDFDV